MSWPERRTADSVPFMAAVPATRVPWSGLKWGRAEPEARSCSRQPFEMTDQLGHLVPRPDQADGQQGQVIGVGLGERSSAGVRPKPGARQHGYDGSGSTCLYQA